MSRGMRRVARRFETHPHVARVIEPPSRIHLHSNRARGVARGAQARPRLRECDFRRNASLFDLGRAHALRRGALVAEDARLERVVGPRVRRRVRGSLHQREGGDERGMARGEDEGGGGAHAESDEEDGADVEVELEDESDGVGGERARGVGGRRGPLTVAVAAGVGGDDAMASRRERTGDGSQGSAGLSEVVEEEDGGRSRVPRRRDAETGGQVDEKDRVRRRARGDGRRRARPPASTNAGTRPGEEVRLETIERLASRAASPSAGCGSTPGNARGSRGGAGGGSATVVVDERSSWSSSFAGSASRSAVSSSVSIAESPRRVDATPDARVRVKRRARGAASIVSRARNRTRE